MSKKLLVVFGATGNQGNSVATHALADPEIAQEYSVRGITRNAIQPAAQALQSKGSEIVQADMDNLSSLQAALKGAHTVFLATNSTYGPNARETEVRQAKAVIDTSIALGAQYIIWSTCSPVTKLSNNTIKSASHFDAKAEIEDYIRAKRSQIKSAFFAPGSFMQNYTGVMKPHPKGDGKFVLPHMLCEDSLLPLIDIRDSGKWINTILASPDQYDGAFLAAAEGLYTMADVARVMSEVSGKVVVPQRLNDEEFKSMFPEGAGLKEPMFDMFLWFREFGYYGPETRTRVEWAKMRVKGEVMGFEGFLRDVGVKALGLE